MFDRASAALAARRAAISIYGASSSPAGRLYSVSFTNQFSDGQGNTTNGVINLFSSPSSLFGPVTGAGNAHSNSMTVNFVGLPGNTYNVERSQDLITWKSIWTTNVPPAGTFRFTDTFGDLGGIVPAYAYYRLAWWPANQ